MANSEKSSLDGSITILLRKLQSGDEEATVGLFQAYFARLAGLGRTLLPANRRRTADEEDLAIEVINSFFVNASSEKMPELKSRHDVWRMLARRLQQRAANVNRDGKRLKRGGGLVSGESAFISKDGDQHTRGIEQIASREEADSHRLQDLVELHQQLSESLTDPELREIATRILQGETPSQISAAMNRSEPTVYRKMKLIATHWQTKNRR
jgi:DNA-binding NarL/FixJ family response regulator